MFFYFFILRWIKIFKPFQKVQIFSIMEIFFFSISLFYERMYALNFLDLNNYEIIKKIGQGGFGEVFKIRNKTTDDFYAAKILIGRKGNSKIAHREVDIMVKLNYPSVLKLIGYSPTNFDNEPDHVIVTEYLPNGTLYDILEMERKSQNTSKFDDTKKLITIYGIASGMSYLHSNRIVHRDLKSQNIFIDGNLWPKVADFGLSKIIPVNKYSLTNSSGQGFKGTPNYIAPEIYEEDSYTKAGDVYAFAMIIYEIMTLKIPFENIEWYRLMFMVPQGKRPELPSQLDKTYKNLIERCWSQNPKDRPSFAEITKELKEDPHYITKNVNQIEFKKYVDSIEKYFVTIEKNIFTQNGTNSDEISFSVLEHLKTIPEFNDLSSEKQDFIVSEIFNFDTHNNLSIDYNKLQVLYESYLLDSEEFIEMISDFSMISIELVYPSQLFDEIFNAVKNIFENHVITIKADLIFNGPEELVYQLGKNDFVDTIKISSSIKTIGESVFSNCASLVHVTIPGTVKSIKSYCFKECPITEITIPSTVDSIGSFCFQNCQQLSIVTIDPYETKIGEHAFSNCNSLTHLNIKTKKKEITEYDENRIEGIQTITILPPVTTICSNAFSNSKFITQITIPSTVTKIGSYAFSNSSSLVQVIFPPSVTVIEDHTFYNCSSLVQVNLPPFLKSIGSSAFAGCSSLTNIMIPHLVHLIQMYAFARCTSLIEIVIPKSVTQIQEHTFSNCSSLKSVILSSKLKSIGTSAFEKCTSLKEITIPQSVTSIGDLCFHYCSSLEKVNMPTNINWIGSKIFCMCSSLPDEYVSSVYNNSKSENESLNFSLSLRFIRSPIILDIIKKLDIKVCQFNSEEDIIWCDSMFTIYKYTHFDPSKHINKIPGICESCRRVNFIKLINSLERKFKKEYGSIIPKTFVIPDEKSECKREILNQVLYGQSTWIFKPNIGVSSEGIQIFQKYQQIEAKINESNGIIQEYVSPKLLNGFKFDFRIFLLITNLNPISLYIYKEGFARFCSELYQSPSLSNFDNHYSHFSSVKLNLKNEKPSNSYIIRSFSSTLEQIAENEIKANEIWEKIKDLSIKSILALLPKFISYAKIACQANDVEFIKKGITPIDPLHRFFHLFAIDFIIDENLNPFVIDLNHNPGMQTINQIDQNIKAELIEDELYLFYSIIKNEKNKTIDKWEQLLPTSKSQINELITKIKSKE